MKQIIDRQTVVISVDFYNLWVDPATGAGIKSEIQLPMNLRFAADELVLKSITYGGQLIDVGDVIQIWCNITHDNILGACPNQIQTSIIPDAHFKISNTFQVGNLVLQFQQTDKAIGEAGYDPQPLISSTPVQHTFNIVVIAIEFLKHAK